MEQSAVDRLANKSPEAAIIDQISRDFHLAPFMACTYFEQMQGYFEQYLNQQRDVGQMTFLAVRASTPPGRVLSECERVAITLTLDSADDLEALRQGIGTLRRSKIQRLTREAQDQGALLTQEDLVSQTVTYRQYGSGFARSSRSLCCNVVCVELSFTQNDRALPSPELTTLVRCGIIYQVDI